MDEQVAEIDIGVAQVVSKDVLAEMLEEQLAGRRLPVELAALMSRAVEGDVCLAVIRHQPAEERWQQRLSVHQQAGDDLLGIERRGLLPKVDVAVDLARWASTAMSASLVGIRQRPQAACEPDRANRPRQPRAPSRPIAVDRSDVGADRGVLRDVAVGTVGDLDLEAFGRDLLEQGLDRCGAVLSTIATILSSLWKGIATVGDLTSRGIIAHFRCATQSTR